MIKQDRYNLIRSINNDFKHSSNALLSVIGNLRDGQDIWYKDQTEERNIKVQKNSDCKIIFVSLCKVIRKVLILFWFLATSWSESQIKQNII